MTSGGAHTHKQPHTRTHRHTRTCSHTHTHTHTHADTDSHTHEHTQTHAHTDKRTRTNAHAHTYTRPHTRTRTRMHTYTRKHTVARTGGATMFLFVPSPRFTQYGSLCSAAHDIPLPRASIERLASALCLLSSMAWRCSGVSSGGGSMPVLPCSGGVVVEAMVLLAALLCGLLVAAWSIGACIWIDRRAMFSSAREMHCANQ